MALKDVGDEAAALALPYSASGDALLDELRSYSWASFAFDNASIWTKERMVFFVFRLEGGEAGTPNESVLSALVEVRPEDRGLYDSLLPFERTDLVDMIREFYLGSSVIGGVEAGVTVPILCSRVLRFWSVRTDEAEGRVNVGKCLDGFTIIGSSGSALRPLATTLGKVGLRSRLGPFCGSGVQAATTKKRLLNFFDEFAPATSANGLIYQASSPREGLSLFQKFWTKDDVLNLDVAQASVICSALGLSPTSSASAPRLLVLTLADISPEQQLYQEPAGVERGPANFPPALAPLELGQSAQAPEETQQTPSVIKRKTPKKKSLARPSPLTFQVDDALHNETDSDSDPGDSGEDSQLARRLVDARLTELLTPRTKTAGSGQELSIAAARVVSSLPEKMQPQFTNLVDEHRTSVVSKTELEALRGVFVANQAAEEMLLARRPLADSVLQQGSPILRVHSLYQCTRLGFPAHMSILAQELTVRTAGGRSLESSLSERQALIKEESLRQEHATVGELLVLLLDELHPQGVLSLRTAERMMRRLVGLEVAAEKKTKSSQSAQKTLAELAEFMGTGMRVSVAAQTQLP